MNIRVFTVILLLFALLPIKDQAFAKCAFEKYMITGTVRDESTRQAISNATLFFFFDDYKSTLSEGYKTKYPDFFRTDTEGDSLRQLSSIHTPAVVSLVIGAIKDPKNLRSS